MTFSIIGIDKKKKEIGVACFSKAFALGGIVPAVDFNSGAVATQSYPNVAYKKEGLELMKKFSSEKVILQMTGKDKGRDWRQVIVMNSKGESEGFTGKKNVIWAGHKKGKDCIAAGNMLIGEKVISNLILSFEKSRGSLASRLIKSISAAQKVGGDKRDEKFNSAAIIIEKKGRGLFGLDNRYIDLRVDDSQDSIFDLKSLIKKRQKMEDWYSKEKIIKSKILR